MKAEEFFASVVLSYQSLLSSGSNVPRLREYCRSRQVSYSDFLRWCLDNETGSGILEIDRIRKRLQKENVVEGKLSGKSGVSEKPLLYPLHIISDSCDNYARSAVIPSILRDVSIAFPNGVKISVSEADSRGIYSLVHGKEW